MKKNNKLKTLIIICLLVIIVLLVLMIIFDKKGTLKSKNDSKNIDAVVYAAKNWWGKKDLQLSNIDDYDKVSVSLNTLIDSEKLDSILKDDLTGCVLIAYDNDKNDYSYTYVDSDECEIYDFVSQIDSKNDICDVSVALYGDINKDGKITVKDKVYLTRYLAGWEGYELDCQSLLNADVNADGIIDSKDLTVLTRHLAKWKDYSILPKKENNNCDFSILTALYGDVDKDGKVTVKDRVYLTRYLADWEGYELDCQSLLNADVNVDGVVDNDDLDTLSKNLAGWNKENNIPTEGDDKCDINTLTASYGDIDKDGKVTVKDSTYLSKYLTGLEGYELDCQSLLNADVNADGIIDSKDLTVLTRHLAKWKDYSILPKKENNNCDFSILTALYGDVDKDGKVTVKDRVYLTRYLADWEGYELDCQSLLNADVNVDGVVDNDDLDILIKHLTKWKDYSILPIK